MLTHFSGACKTLCLLNAHSFIGIYAYVCMCCILPHSPINRILHEYELNMHILQPKWSEHISAKSGHFYRMYVALIFCAFLVALRRIYSFIHTYMYIYIFCLPENGSLDSHRIATVCGCFFSSLCVRFKLVRCIIIKSLHHFMEFFNRIIIENVFQSNVLCIFCVKQITNNHHFCSNSTLYLLFPVFIASSIVFSRSHSLFFSLS